MAAVTQYNSKDWVVMVGGVHITQLGEDGASGSKDEELSSAAVGALGDVVQSITNNDLGTITLTVQPTCPQLSYLIGLAKTTELFPISVSNKSLGISYGGSKASLKNYPEITGGTEAEDYEFEFQVYDYEVTQD